MNNNLNNEIIDHAESVLGFSLRELEQGSDEWLIAKLGVMSASEASDILSGAKTKTKRTYIATKIGQVITGVPDEEFNAKALRWGKENEHSARTAYEMLTGKEVIEEGFSYKDFRMRVGFSADGIVLAERKGLEIKCPITSKVYALMACFSDVKTEWEKQVQFSMWASGLEQWDLAIYDPRVVRKKLLIHTFEKDFKIHDLFEEATAEISFLMDQKLAEIGYKFGDQWRDRIDVAKGISA